MDNNSNAISSNLLQFQFEPSFVPFIRLLRDRQEKSKDIRVKFYRYLVKKFEQQPHLLTPFKDPQVLEQHHDLVQLLRMSLLPLATSTEDIPMALAFLQPRAMFYYTPLFKRIFNDENILFNSEEDNLYTIRYFVNLVLERCYDVSSDVHTRITKQVISRDKNMVRYYQVSIDSRFVDVHVNAELPPYDQQWIELLNASDADLPALFKNFPAHNFRLEGFCMFTTEDVSEEVALNKLKNAVLNMHTVPLTETQKEVSIAISELVGDPRTMVAVTPFFKINDRLVYDPTFLTDCAGFESDVELGNGLPMDEIYAYFLARKKPLIYPDAAEKSSKSQPYLCSLVASDVQSFIVYPIHTRNGLIGVFELGLPEENHIDNKIMQCLRPAVPLITELVNFMLEMFDSRIQRLVKEKFTPLQQSVEWKFNEVAWKYLLQETGNKRDKVETVVFEDVFPFYGAVDIKNSSVERNLASKKDYIIQLNATLAILRHTAQFASLPLLDSTVYKCERLLTDITDILTSEDELSIRDFLENEVYVLFRHMAERDTSLATMVEEYMRKTDRETGEFHTSHQAYEQSTNQINKQLNQFFEEEMRKLQKVYPFYYEKYKTDGVEYNIYIGNSIAPRQTFNPIYLKNLRAWQVSSMAQVTRLNYQLSKTLAMPLQTTQLILVHGSSIDISFRKDERRFDVEGAYNIRYEILKKRIDKVRIKGTTERLTQPGKIAIVYSSQTEIKEYLQHINYLVEKRLLTDNLEMIDLENVQGISGLKAVRVGVNLTDDAGDTSVEQVQAIISKSR